MLYKCNPYQSHNRRKIYKCNTCGHAKAKNRIQNKRTQSLASPLSQIIKNRKSIQNLENSRNYGWMFISPLWLVKKYVLFLRITQTSFIGTMIQNGVYIIGYYGVLFYLVEWAPPRVPWGLGPERQKLVHRFKSSWNGLRTLIAFQKSIFKKSTYFSERKAIVCRWKCTSSKFL